MISVFSNRDALLKTLDEFSKHIHQVKSAIQSSDSEQLLKIFKRAKQARDNFVISRKLKETSIE